MRPIPEFVPAEIDVLVVGAGPVGLATACALRIHGVKCRIVDRLQEPTPLSQSRALALWARTLEVFDDLGCVGPVFESGLRARAVNAYHDRERLFRVPLDVENADTPYPNVMVLPQGQTERILIARLAELGTEVERGVRVSAIEQGSTSVIATVVDANEREARITAKWLVGCDGAHSIVRHALGLDFQGNAYPETFRLWDGTLDWELNHSEAHMFLLSGGGGMAVFPLPGEKQWRLVDVSDVAVSDEPGAMEERFRSLLTSEVPGAAAMGETTWVSSFRVQRRITDHFRVGRCFVAGDAAHIHSPAGGQGMNTGIQDGHNLAWKLAMVLDGTARESLLDSYESERRPVAEGVLHHTDMLTRAVMMKNPVGRWIRNTVVPLVAGVAFVQKKLVREQSELEIDYGTSPIVKEGGGGFRDGPRAGRRCPDVLLGTKENGSAERLFDYLEADKHTLLLFMDQATTECVADGIKAFLEAIQGTYGSWMAAYVVIARSAGEERLAWPCATIIDRHRRLHVRFGAVDGTVYLIRPDGYVGYRGVTGDLGAFRDYVLAAYGAGS
jgi:2-polyprenyl-6-methoxyphenol hydroxylase-like FAD-dependent oxidoreductase